MVSCNKDEIKIEDSFPSISFENGMVVIDSYEDFQAILTHENEDKFEILINEIESNISTFNKELNKLYDLEETVDISREDNFNEFLFFPGDQTERYEPIIVEDSKMAYLLNDNREIKIGNEIMVYNVDNITIKSSANEIIDKYDRNIIIENNLYRSCPDCSAFYHSKRKITGQYRKEVYITNGYVNFIIFHKLLSEKKTGFFGRWGGTESDYLELLGTFTYLNPQTNSYISTTTSAASYNSKRINDSYHFSIPISQVSDFGVTDNSCNFYSIDDGVSKSCSITGCGI